MKKILAAVYAAVLVTGLIGCSDSGSSSSEINETRISNSSFEAASDNISDNNLSDPSSESTAIPRITSIAQNTMIVTKSSKIQQMESMISDLGKRKNITQRNNIRDDEITVIYESPENSESTGVTIDTDMIEKSQKESQ